LSLGCPHNQNFLAPSPLKESSIVYVISFFIINIDGKCPSTNQDRLKALYCCYFENYRSPHKMAFYSVFCIRYVEFKMETIVGLTME